MAKKINTRVLIIGIIVIVGLVMFLGAGLFAMSWRKSPKRYVSKAETILSKLSQQTIDLDNKEQIKDYKKAAGYYVAAFNNTKDTAQQIDYLNKAIDIFKGIKQWDSMVGCWNKIVTIDVGNWQARKNIIDYLKTRAESGEVAIWQTIGTNVQEYIDTKTSKGFEIEPEMYYLKGKALYFSAMLGSTADAKITISEAVDSIEKAVNSPDANDSVQYYHYLTQAIIAKGKMMDDSGVLNALEDAKKQAHQLFAQYIKKHPDDANAYVYDLAVDLTDKNRDELIALEPEFIKLADKFPDSAEVLNAIANFYNQTGQKLKAQAQIEKALAIEPNNINYLISEASLSYDCYKITNDNKYKQIAVKQAEKALKHPDSQETNVVTKAANKNRKLMLHSLLAQIYIEDVLVHPDKELLQQAKEHIHQIKQLIASPDSALAMKWDGLSLLAEGKKNQAQSLLYKAYEKIKASKNSDPFLSYNLSVIFKNSNEQGLLFQFLNDALSNRDFLMTRPDVLMDYIKMLTDVSPASALKAIETYQALFKDNKQLKLIKLNALTATNKIEAARELVSTFDKNDPNRIIGETKILSNDIRQNFVAKIQLQNKINAGDKSSEKAMANLNISIKQQQKQLFNLIDKILKTAPKLLPLSNFRDYYSYCMSNGMKDIAKDAVDIMSKTYPDDTNLKFLHKISALKDPNNLDEATQLEIRESAIKEISEPTKRLAELGQLYLSSNRKDLAKKAYKELLEADPNNTTAIYMLFDIVSAQKDINDMKILAQKAQKINLDMCNGLTFYARVDFLEKKSDAAIEKLNKCIKEKPFISFPYYLRSKILADQGKFKQAIDDAATTLRYNPFNKEYSKNYALIMYQRDTSLGKNISNKQIVQTRDAIQKALKVNINDTQLRTLYVDTVGQTEPEKAIAVLQSLQKEQPSYQNAMRIATLATKIVTVSPAYMSKKLRNAFYDMAESSLKTALKYKPDSEDALKIYAEILRQTGREDQAEELLTSDSSLLWRFNLKNGEYEKARNVLSKLYSQNSKDPNVLSGLLLVAEKTRDVDAVKKYSAELTAIDPGNVDRQLVQIRSFIEVNLINQAKDKADALIAKGNNSPSLYLLKALISMRFSKLNEALNMTETALAKDPAIAQGWRLKGQINSLLGNFTQAIEDLKKSKSLSDTPETRIDLAKAYIQTGQKNNAITELNTAVDNPQVPMLAWTLLENIYLKTKNISEITSFYEKAISKFSKSPLWYNRFADYHFSNKNYDKSVVLYQLGWKTSPEGNRKSFNGYVESLIKAKNYNRAISFASAHIDDKYSIFALLYIGKAKLDSGDIEAAKDFFNKAINRADKDYTIIGNTASFLVQQAGPKLSEELMKTKYMQNSQSSQMNYAMFIIEINQNNYDKALKYIASAIELAKDNAAKQKLISDRLGALQRAYSETKREDFLNQVISEYEEQLKVNKNQPGILNNVAYLLAHKNIKLEKALDYARRALELVPNNPGIMDTYAYVMIRNKDYKQALTILNRAKQLFERESANAPADFYDHYATVNDKLGNKDIALNSYRKALDVGGDSFSKEDKERITNAIKNLEQEN